MADGREPYPRVPLPNEVWLHTQTQKHVRIVDLARDEPTAKTLVLYREVVEPSVLWARTLEDFLYLDPSGWRRFHPKPS